MEQRQPALSRLSGLVKKGGRKKKKEKKNFLYSPLAS
jgi:hypothetical protein